MDFDRILARATAAPNDEVALAGVARAALHEEREEDALSLLRFTSERLRSARLWQWRGLLERSLDEHEAALQSFSAAAVLDPNDVSIAHGHARVALEAGVPAGELFKVALQNSPTNPDILLGYVASLLADGRASAAEATLEGAISRAPLWIDGHAQLAQLRSITGKRDIAAASLIAALRRYPEVAGLWVALFKLLAQTGQFSALYEAIEQARRVVPRDDLMRFEVIAAVEGGHIDRADQLLGAVTQPLKQQLAVWSIRHDLRTGRIDAASRTVDSALQSEIAADIWPYAAIVWRLLGDRRQAWLEDDIDRSVQSIDLSAAIAMHPSLETTLRKLHSGKTEFLDQSVRGGSQTDGPLFTRIDPDIRALRSTVIEAVRPYVGEFRPPDRNHPLFAPARDRPVRFAGSWSVLLRGRGYHANHVHPQGWISSAMYIHVPDRGSDDAPTAGWLTLGEPQAELKVNLPAFAEIEPQVGRLVLFPSWMWHGTRPFTVGERLTVAFDVKRPR